MTFKNGDLDRLLKQDPLPQRPESYWHSFPARVATRLQSSFSGSAPAASRDGQRIFGALTLGFGLGLACLILTLKYGAFTQPESRAPLKVADVHQTMSYAKIMAEVGAMFPNRVRSVTLEGDDIQLNLADDADVATSPPIWVQICLGGRCKKFITFSGQQVGVDGHVYDVLVDSRGNVMLTGETSVWSSGERVAAIPGARISAHLL
ncbi:MAG: hypothetical protein H7X97_04550 [Opitutaceae bacterium]|nr:hypothetical protein [Verrucomicrobiales bacterium]